MPSNESTASGTSSLTLQDVYYVLFKRKWLIVGFSILAFVAAVVVFFKMAPPYQSEAKLLVRYITEDKGLTGAGEIKQVDARGETIISGETEILNSRDIAESVVAVLGATKILGPNALSDRTDAATELQKGLLVDTPRKGNVIRVAYKHSDPEVVEPVLRLVIDNYFKKHVKVHQALGMYDEVLQAQTDQLRAQLGTTEDELRQLKSKVNVTSLEETKKMSAEERSKIREEIRVAELETAEHQASLAALLEQDADGKVDTNRKAGVSLPKPSPDQMAAYKRLMDDLESRFIQERKLLSQFTEENLFVREMRSQIRKLEEEKKAMETATPGLLEQEKLEISRATGSPLSDRESAIILERVHLARLAAKLKELTGQQEKLRNDARAVEEAESKIVELQRKKEMQETQFRSASLKLEEARLEGMLSAGKISNIIEIQSPTPPFRDSSQRLKKVAAVLVGGTGAGLVLAFLLELALNQAFRNPTAVSASLRLPVFVSVPEFTPRTQRAQARLSANEPGALAVEVKKMAPWDQRHDLHPYSEALRDRLVTFFEVRNMTHKPKLIAVTSCGRGAGVTSVAAGLAASLSETGEGNVLLVDMSQGDGAAHPFYRGKPACGLEDVLAQDKRDMARINDKLYLVTAGSGDDRLPKILPKRFTHLLPKLQASDYDYIIFDMPPVTQTSPTPRLAGLMDVVLMLVEADKTGRDIVRQTSALLTENKANLGIVFNRRRTFVPQWLQQEF